jgi:5-oxoprolinase (ATP-hydrolysing)
MVFEFYIDRGGTFTDIVAKAPDGEIFVYKVLSELPDQNQDPAIVGIATILSQVKANQALSNPTTTSDQATIGQVRIGTTVATNALLERKGEPLLLVTNQGMKDAFKIEPTFLP